MNARSANLIQTDRFWALVGLLPVKHVAYLGIISNQIKLAFWKRYPLCKYWLANFKVKDETKNEYLRKL